MSKMKKIVSSLLSACILITLVMPSTSFAADNGVQITSAVPTPMITVDAKQEVTVEIDNGTGSQFSGSVKAIVGDGSSVECVTNLTGTAAGVSKATVLVPDIQADTNLILEVYSEQDAQGDRLSSYGPMEWKKARHWRVPVTQNSHVDVGYTGFQDDLYKGVFTTCLDNSLNLAKQTAADSPEKQYSYLIEAATLLGDAFMKNRSADKINEVVGYLNESRFSISAANYSSVSESMGIEDAVRSASFTNRKLNDKLGITSDYMIIDDVPSISKGYIDIAANSGIEYIYTGFNGARDVYPDYKQYYAMYMEGVDPSNKVLVYNGPHYGTSYGLDGGNFATARNNIVNQLRQLEQFGDGFGTKPYQKNAYPYDIMPILISLGDNTNPNTNIMNNTKAINADLESRGYAWPKIYSSSDLSGFFEYLEENFADQIPMQTGTVEDWWNDGGGTIAFETGINKQQSHTLPAAETAAMIASMTTGEAFPYNDVDLAYRGIGFYNEHTWGASSRSLSGGFENQNYKDQWEWKRSNAFEAKAMTDKVYTGSLNSLSSQVQTEGSAIYVYNPLNWSRDDLVKVDDLSSLPATFEILDGENPVSYKIEDGVLTFVASGVPALGYKTFELRETDSAADFTSSGVVDEANRSIENDFYKVTFAVDGTVSSIIDKKNDGREMVAQDDAAKFNQYLYYDDAKLPHTLMADTVLPENYYTLHTPEEGTLRVDDNGISVEAAFDTGTFRASKITQTVTLYDNIPRIDINNRVLKESVVKFPTKEEAYYVFPFNTSDDFEIRHDMPVGNITPNMNEGDIVSGSCTDWYTVNKWINVKDKADDYNIAVALPNTSLVQYGERTNFNWSVDYVPEKPTIYSYVMNNLWNTNYQHDQPGLVDYTYSITSDKSSELDNTIEFGHEINTPLQATVIRTAQPDVSGKQSDTYLSIDRQNVQLTTMKMAEANGDGVIVRLNEIAGKAADGVTVTLPKSIASVTETDLIENDKADSNIAVNGSSFTFDIGAYGIKTFRVKFVSDNKPAKVTGVTAQVPMTGQNLSKTATVTASSSYDSRFVPENAVSIGDRLDWAVKGSTDKDPWILFTWDKPVTISNLLVADRVTAASDLHTGVKLTFDDNTTMDISGVSPASKLVALPEPKTTTSIKVNMTELVKGTNYGLDGIEFYEGDVGSIVGKENGTLIAWDAAENAQYYEVFRSNTPDFTAGTGNYLCSTPETSVFDTQVPANTQGYFYKVRAVGLEKGDASEAAALSEGGFTDTTPPTAPILSAIPRDYNRVDLYWTTSSDNTGIKQYDVYRDGTKIGSTRGGRVISYRDTTASKNTVYNYSVKAVDKNGNATESNILPSGGLSYENDNLTSITASIGALSPAFDPSITKYTLNVGSAYETIKTIDITPVAQSDKLSISINGKAAVSGQPTTVDVKTNKIIAVTVTTPKGSSKAYTITLTSEPMVIVPAGSTAGSEYSTGPARYAIDNSGMSDTSSVNDLHDNHPNGWTMWYTKANPGANGWYKVDLGKIYALDELWIWNLNQYNPGAGTEDGKDMTDRGMKDVKIEYSIDGQEWFSLKGSNSNGDENYPYVLAKGTGKANMPATNLYGTNEPVKFDGIKAQYVRLTARPVQGSKVGGALAIEADVPSGSWGDIYWGLSEIRFTEAFEVIEPEPENKVTVSDVGVISGAQGTQFNVPVTVSNIMEDTRSIEGVITLPKGVTAVNATANPLTVKADNFEWNVAEGKLRFAFINTVESKSIDFTGGEMFTIQYELTEEFTEETELSIAFDRFTLSNGTVATPLDVTGATAHATTVSPVIITPDAAELYTGDGIDLIPETVKAVRITFTGLESTAKIRFGDTVCYYNPQISEKSGLTTYVAIVPVSVTLDELNNVESYTISETGNEDVLMFGDTNDDGSINASDALNIVSAWLRKNPIDEAMRDVLIMNVSADGRIDTYDAISVVDYVVNSTPFEIVK